MKTFYIETKKGGWQGFTSKKERDKAVGMGKGKAISASVAYAKMDTERKMRSPKAKAKIDVPFVTKELESLGYRVERFASDNYFIRNNEDTILVGSTKDFINIYKLAVKYSKKGN